MLRDLISEREKELPVSTIGKLITIVEEQKGIISLGAGELDYAAPSRVRQAAINAIKQGETHYSPPQGRTDLREALAKKLKRENKIDAQPGDIVVTNGSTEGILLALLCTVDPGEGVLVPDPGFLAYTPAVEVLNGMPLTFELKEEERFAYTWEAMEASVVPEKTQVLIMNTPANPTGQLLTKKELEEIADFAVEYDIAILSDEAYEKFVYQGKHVSIGALNGMSDRVVTLHSFSKSFAMPGFRLGYAHGPSAVIQAMTKVHVFSSICASPISQIAAMQALKEKATTTRMVTDYKKRGRYLWKRMRDMPGVECLRPEGAFYLFPSIHAFDTSSADVARHLLKKAKVAVVPGTEFGRRGEGYIRLSYATSLPLLKKAADRLERVFASWV